MPQEIGRELGVDYLLVGKVRWAKLPGGASRVQVSPELIDTPTADARWQRPFDAALTDIFQVQGDIAGQVAQALDVELGSRQQEALAAKPTQNLAAYDLYLKGQAQLAFGPGPATLRQAVGYFEQAVALDSGFVAAWVWLSASSGLMYINGVPLPAVADRARSAAERALALAPPGSARILGPRWVLSGHRSARARGRAVHERPGVRAERSQPAAGSWHQRDRARPVGCRRGALPTRPAPGPQVPPTPKARWAMR